MAQAQPAAERPLALITGASSGIGYELARNFAERGFDLILTSSDAAKLNEAAHSVSAIDPEAEVEVVQADLATPEGVETLYGAARAIGRPIDVLAANAGVGVHGDFAAETDLDAEITLINLNVTSQVHLIKLIARDMIARGEGDILITSSVAGALPGPRMAVYAASKAFLRSFGHAIRNELEEHGVNVTVLMPGPTDTDFFDRARMTDTVVAQGPKQDPADVAQEAIDALERGDDHVVTGMRNKLQMGAARFMSNTARARAHGKQTERKAPRY